jgi:WD40 repeat protein
MEACSTMRRTDARFDGAVGSFSPDGSLLALLGSDAAPLQVLRLSDDSMISDFEIPVSHHYYRVAVSPDNTLLAAAGDAVTIFRVADGTMLADVPMGGQGPGGGHAMNLDFSHDGRLLATANGSDVTVGVWSVPELGLVSSFSLHDSEFAAVVSFVAFSPDDSRLVAVTGNAPVSGNVVVTSNVADGSRVWSQDRLDCYQVGDVRFSPDGTQIVEGCLSGSNGILDAATGRLITVLGKASRGVGSVDYYDNDHILIGDDGVGARIWARDAAGAWSPSCLLTSAVPQWGQVAASPGGRWMFLHVNGGANSTWIYEQAP